MENAALGRILGFDTYLDQNVNAVMTGADVDATLSITEPHAAGYASTLEIAITGTAGEYLNIAGNDQPTYMTDATTGAVVLNEALKYAVLDNAVVTRYKACDVNAAAQTGTTYAAGYSKGILLDGHTVAMRPQIGQLICLRHLDSPHLHDHRSEDR